MSSMRFLLEGQEESGGKRALIIIPPNDTDPELVFNVDTYQNIAISEEKEELKRENELEKLHDQLDRAIVNKDTVAEERLVSQIRFSGTESIAAQTIKYVNMLLRKLSDEKALVLYKYFDETLTIIRDFNITNRRETMSRLTKATMDLFIKVDLAAYCIRFTEIIDPPLPDPTSVGWKHHHSASKTFSVRSKEAPDYVEMTAMAFLAKLLFPIWGQYCQRMKMLGLGSIDKEYYCLQFLEPALLKSDFSRIYKKFRNYTFDEVRRAMDKSARNPYGNESNYDRNLFTLAKQGYNIVQFQMLNLAKILVKRLVVFNVEVSSLKGEDNIPNIMIFSQAIMEKNVTNTLKQFNANSALLTRDEPRGQGDDTSTFMENCSRITKQPPDMPIYTRRGCELSIPREVVARGFDEAEFWELVNYYHGDKLLKRNVFTDAVLSVYLFPIIGSSENINHLQAKQYIMAVALAQLRLLREVDHPYGQALALMLTASQSVLPRVNKIDTVTTTINTTCEKCEEYRALMDRYPHSCETVILNESIIGSKPIGVKKDRIKGTINIAKHVTMIKDWLLDYDHYVNICPTLWKYIPNITKKSRQKQNDILQYSSDFMTYYYQFILDNCPEAQDVPTEGDMFFKELGYN